MKRRVAAKRRARMLAVDRQCERAMLRHNSDPAYSAMLGKKTIFEQPEVARWFAKLERAIDLLPPFTREGKRFKIRRA